VSSIHRAQRPWTLWTPHRVTHVVHPYDAELDAHFTGQKIPFDVRTGDAAICADRRHRLDATDRWFTNTWRKPDSKVKASIVKGVVVFLSLFDENPAVYRAFSPARAVYADPKPGEQQPLPPLEDLLETGHVLGLNFPVALNPALARGLGVMLKLDFQHAVLRRIPKIAAHRDRAWRDLFLDSAVTEVMVNEGGRRVFIEREGMLEAVPKRVARGRDVFPRAERSRTAVRGRLPRRHARPRGETAKMSSAERARRERQGSI